jgi:hypothetical protein
MRKITDKKYTGAETQPLTNDQIDRIIDVGRLVWENLTEDERDYHFMNGSLGFLEDILSLLGLLDECDFTNVEQVEYVHDQIVFGHE